MPVSRPKVELQMQKACRTCDQKTLFSFQRGIYAHFPSFITELSLGTKAQTFCHLATSFSPQSPDPARR